MIRLMARQFGIVTPNYGLMGSKTLHINNLKLDSKVYMTWPSILLISFSGKT